jgi:pyruvate dehydrogenase E2 component (dihydrolipoamide acetyltransferase)
MRHAVAEAMARSKREIPHYYLSTDIDFSRARAWLDAANASRPVTERVVPAVLTAQGFPFEHPTLEGALRALLDRPAAA